MWIQVRSMDGKKSLRIDGLSKLTKVEQLREKLVKDFDAPCDRQRLFCRGKQMVDGHTLFDYNINLNEILQLLVKPPELPTKLKKTEEDDNAKDGTDDIAKGDGTEDGTVNGTRSKIVDHQIGSSNNYDDDRSEKMRNVYRPGDVVDIKDDVLGAWWEGEIVKVLPRNDGTVRNVSLSNGHVNGSRNNGDAIVSDCHIDGSLNNGDTLVSDCHIDGSLNNGDALVSDCHIDGSLNKGDTLMSDCHIDGSRNNGDAMVSDGHIDGSRKNGDAMVSDGQVNGSCRNEVSLSNENVLVNDLSESKGDVDTLNRIEKNDDEDDDGCDYHVQFEGEEEITPGVTSVHIRPRSYHKLNVSELTVGQKVMVNYHYDEPKERGHWYDSKVTRVNIGKNRKEVFGTVFIGKDSLPIENCNIKFVDEIFRIETTGSQRNADDEIPPGKDGNSRIEKRKTKADCDHCLDNPRKKCKHCACTVCGNKNEPDKQLMCDECNSAFHIYCLAPPLLSIPDDDEWFCPDCKLDTSSIVKAGEKLKESKKKMKMASSQSGITRDWGKGMACQGRSKMCTIVASNHFGPIPGVEVGSQWKFRVQVSESGIHRPHVAGIHGRENEGAYSIVLSGGYEDDQDDGEEFTYTGSGGRDLSGNKRTADQSCDQVLTRMNMALAKNCNVPLDAKNGTESVAWCKGKPVRVVRNCKGRKHSVYAPVEGNRYDGIYKIVKYWPEKGKSGFVVWRYLLKRDDPIPPPWTKEGKFRIEELGLTMQYPDGWQDSSKKKNDIENESDTGNSLTRGEEDDEACDNSIEEKNEAQKKKKTKRKSSIKNKNKKQQHSDDEEFPETVNTKKRKRRSIPKNNKKKISEGEEDYDDDSVEEELKDHSFPDSVSVVGEANKPESKGGKKNKKMSSSTSSSSLSSSNKKKVRKLDEESGSHDDEEEGDEKKKDMVDKKSRQKQKKKLRLSKETEDRNLPIGRPSNFFAQNGDKKIIDKDGIGCASTGGGKNDISGRNGGSGRNDISGSGVTGSGYKVDADILNRISEDCVNRKVWDEVLMSSVSLGKKKFLERIEELFLCICCQELVLLPITTNCLHNFCKACLGRSSKAGVNSCPTCRYDLGADGFKLQVNDNLKTILSKLFIGYENGR